MNKTKKKKKNGSKVKVKIIEPIVGAYVMHKVYGKARIKEPDFAGGIIIDLLTKKGQELMSKHSGCPIGSPLLVFKGDIRPCAEGE